MYKARLKNGQSVAVKVPPSRTAVLSSPIPYMYHRIPGSEREATSQPLIGRLCSVVTRFQPPGPRAARQLFARRSRVGREDLQPRGVGGSRRPDREKRFSCHMRTRRRFGCVVDRPSGKVRRGAVRGFSSSQTLMGPHMEESGVSNT